MAKILKCLSGTDEMRRMMTGPIVERLLKVLKDDKDQKKIYLYGGHEFNIAAFIGAHNISGTPATPDYGSALIFERLSGPDGRKYIRVRIQKMENNFFHLFFFYFRYLVLLTHY